MGDGGAAAFGSLELTAMNCHHRFFSLESFFSSARRNGFTSVEIWTAPQHFFIDYARSDRVERLARLGDEHGVRVIGICPEQTNPKPANMAARGPEAQGRAYRYFKRVIDVACGLAARQVVVTSGWAFLDEPAASAWHRSVAMLRRVAEYAGERGMTLAIEALQRDESVLVNTAAELRRLIDDVGADALKVCLDTGAMARAGDTIAGYFDLFGERVAHSHFVDAGPRSTHLAWGDGARDMGADIRALLRCGYRGALSVELASPSYFEDPAAADRQSITRFRRACEGFGPNGF